MEIKKSRIENINKIPTHYIIFMVIVIVNLFYCLDLINAHKSSNMYRATPPALHRSATPTHYCLLAMLLS